jgi:hypothetical protein
LPDISLGGRRNPDARESVGQKQIEDVQGIPRVGLLLSYPHRTDLRRISHPKLVVIFPEYFLEPLRIHSGFYARAGSESDA